MLPITFAGLYPCKFSLHFPLQCTLGFPVLSLCLPRAFLVLSLSCIAASRGTCQRECINGFSACFNAHGRCLGSTPSTLIRVRLAGEFGHNPAITYDHRVCQNAQLTLHHANAIIHPMITEDIQARLQSIKVVSFDLDDTLWDCEPAIIRAERVLHQWLTENTPKIAERYDVDALRAHRMSFNAKFPELTCDVTALRKASLAALMDEVNYPVEYAEIAFSTFYRARSEVDLYHDAISVLESLKQGYSLTALTNGNADLDIAGVNHLFDDVQRASVSLAPKPAPDMFHVTADNLAVRPHEILHIGDNPETDVGGSHNAGTMSVWFNQRNDTWPDHLQPADIEISGLGELVTILPLCQRAD